MTGLGGWFRWRWSVMEDLGSWVRLPWLAHDEAQGPYITIPQYRFNKTNQHAGDGVILVPHKQAAFFRGGVEYWFFDVEPLNHET